MLRHGGDVFLDGVTLAEVEKALSVPVIPIAQDGREFLSGVLAANNNLGQKEV
jgi:NifB/MoaA-like Fe-S oxidoreductase